MKAAIVGSGNIGTDLMLKVRKSPGPVEMGVLVGIDPASDGLALAERLGVATTADGLPGLLAMPEFADIDLVFDATSASAHLANAADLVGTGRKMIDLTPAALGPFVVPVVNLDEHLDAPDINMITCGGQATIPVVAAVSRVTPVPYAEIVASIASRSAGPGTRANIDEFTVTTATAIERVGGAGRGKAIIVLNPADPPMIMRDTVLCLAADGRPGDIAESIEAMVADVAAYVPGYRLKQPVQVTAISADEPLGTLIGPGVARPRWKVATFLEVKGAADFLPAYAGNLDIMTSAALRTAEALVASGRVLTRSLEAPA